MRGGRKIVIPSLRNCRNMDVFAYVDLDAVTYPSTCGRILTVLAIMTLLASVGWQIRDLFFRNEMLVTREVAPFVQEIPSPVSQWRLQLFLRKFGVPEKPMPFRNTSYFNVTMNQVTVFQNRVNKTESRTYVPIPYQNCPPPHETDMCPMASGEIQGRYEKDVYKFVAITMAPCFNNTDGVVCATDEEVDSLFATYQVAVSLWVPDLILGGEVEHFSTLTKQFYFAHEIYYEITKISEYSQWFWVPEKINNVLSPSSNRVRTSIWPVLYCNFYLQFGTTKTLEIREHRTTLVSAFATIGAIWSGVLLLFGLFTTCLRRQSCVISRDIRLRPSSEGKYERILEY